MKKLILIYIIVLISIPSIKSYSQIYWNTFIGNCFSNGPSQNFSSLKIDSAGNSFLTGGTYSSIFPISTGCYQDTIVNKSNDVFVTKLDSSGKNIIFSTFIGGNTLDVGTNIAIDKFGNSYITGISWADKDGIYTYPTTFGAFSRSSTGDFTLFVTKVNPYGTSLIYSTYIGEVYQANYFDRIVLSSKSEAYITSTTNDSYYPGAVGSYDTNLNGTEDAIISKLDQYGSNLIYSTYIGGEGVDESTSIVLDNEGNSYITGETYTNKQSNDFPTTPGVFQRNYTFFNYAPNNFILGLVSSGKSLVYSTFIGVGGGLDISLDKNKNSYITGGSAYRGYPVTSGSYDTILNESADIIVSKINPSASALVYSTFIGGATNDIGLSLFIDNYNNVYVAGVTDSRDFPILKGAIDTSYGGGWWDGFFLELNREGSKLLYSSYLGGVTDDYCHNIVLDNKKNVYLSGITNSKNFPVTSNAFDSTYIGGHEVFVAKIGLCDGEPKTQALDSIIFPAMVCGSFVQDTSIILLNSGTCALDLDKMYLSGLNISNYSITASTGLPLELQIGDSIKISITFTPDNHLGKKTATLNIKNNTSINPYIINLSARNDSIAFNLGNTESDTIVIDLGTICPGSDKDTTITIINKSSIGTTLQIDNVDPELQLNVKDKPGKKEGVKTLAAPKKKKKTP